MHTLLLLEMAASGHGDRTAARHGDDQLTYEQLLRSAWAAAASLEDARHLVYVGTNGLAYPIGLFGAAAAGIPFIPLNYRLADEQIDSLLRHHDDVVVVADEGIDARLRDLGHRVVSRSDFVNAAIAGADPGDASLDGDDIALLLYTSGTTAAPKAAVLRHRHLASYVIGSVEFGAAEESDAVLVCVPPYHIAGVANLLSNTYLGRRIVYLDRFDPELWLDTVRREEITHAMVVPTMLARLGDALADQTDAATPTLRSLSYGGSRTPATVLERIMDLFPNTDLTNAYGLTETSSTIAVLGPDDHRAAVASDDPLVRARLASAGRLLPTIEVELRDNMRAGRAGRGRRHLGSGRAGVGRVRRRAALRGRRRVVPHPRSRLARRRRLPLHRGPQRRHHHSWRREHRAGRDRGGVAGPPRRQPVRGRRRARRRVGPADRRRRRTA